MSNRSRSQDSPPHAAAAENPNSHDEPVQVNDGPDLSITPRDFSVLHRRPGARRSESSIPLHIINPTPRVTSGPPSRPPPRRASPPPPLHDHLHQYRSSMAGRLGAGPRYHPYSTTSRPAAAAGPSSATSRAMPNSGATLYYEGPLLTEQYLRASLPRGPTGPPPPPPAASGPSSATSRAVPDSGTKPYYTGLSSTEQYLREYLSSGPTFPPPPPPPPYPAFFSPPSPPQPPPAHHAADPQANGAFGVAFGAAGFGRTAPPVTNPTTAQNRAVPAWPVGIDLSSLTARLRWLPSPPADVDLLLREYQRYLQLRVAHRDEDGSLLAPSPTIERVWRTHVLDTRGYAAMNRMLPFFVHYAEEEHGGEERARRVANTRGSYRSRWGEPPAEIWDDDCGAAPTAAAAPAASVRPSPSAGPAAPAPPSSTAAVPLHTAPAPPPPTADHHDTAFDLVVLTLSTGQETVLRVRASDTVQTVQQRYATLSNNLGRVIMFRLHGEMLPFWATLAQCGVDARAGRVTIEASSRAP